MPMTQTRRQFINSVALASAAGLLHIPRVAAAEGPPETTSVRLPKILSSVWIVRTLIGSPILHCGRWISSPMARSTPFSVFRPSLRSSAHATPATSLSTQPWIALGRNISAACWPTTVNLSATIRLQPNA